MARSARRRGWSRRGRWCVAARYDMAPATRDFGYVPRVSIAEGLERLRAAWEKNPPAAIAMREGFRL